MRVWTNRAKVESGVGVGAVTPALSERENCRIFRFSFEFTEFKDFKIQLAIFAGPLAVYHFLLLLMQIAFCTLEANPEPDGPHLVLLLATPWQIMLLQIVVATIISGAMPPAFVL